MIVGSLPHAAGRELGDGMSRGGSSLGLRRVAIRAATTAVDAVGQNRRVHHERADVAHVTFVDESRASLARRRACRGGGALNPRAGCQWRAERGRWIGVSGHRFLSWGLFRGAPRWASACFCVFRMFRHFFLDLGIFEK